MKQQVDTFMNWV